MTLTPEGRRRKTGGKIIVNVGVFSQEPTRSDRKIVGRGYIDSATEKTLVSRQLILRAGLRRSEEEVKLLYPDRARGNLSQVRAHYASIALLHTNEYDFWPAVDLVVGEMVEDRDDYDLVLGEDWWKHFEWTSFVGGREFEIVYGGHAKVALGPWPKLDVEPVRSPPVRTRAGVPIRAMGRTDLLGRDLPLRAKQKTLPL